MSATHCEHGVPLPDDDAAAETPCDICFDIEMTLYHCRACGEWAYWAHEFMHKPDCPGPRGPVPLGVA